MSVFELGSGVLLAQQMPENLCLYWGGIFRVALLWMILKVLWKALKIFSSKPFKRLCRLLRTALKELGELCKSVAKEAAKDLEPPKPYPRVAKFFAIVFMINGYLLSFLSACWALVLAVLLSLPNTLHPLVRMGAVFLPALLVYFACFFFVQSEKDRIALQGQ